MTSQVRSIATLAEPRVRHDSAGWASLARKLLLGRLRRLEHGELRLMEPDGVEHRFGAPSDTGSLSVTVHVDDRRFFADVAFGGTVGAGESYIEGRWRCDDLVALIRLFIVNRHVMQDVDGIWASFSRPLLKGLHWLNRNTRGGSARNIAAHYDLGNDLYELMLDATMAYSCGIFESSASTLQEASAAKFEAACRKLSLQPQHRVLEIGCGWGGFAIHAASRYGCHVTATTISRQQYDFAAQRIAAAGLNDRITLLLEDYRDLTGSFDRIVSIEMIEAVGANYLDTYTSACAGLLKSDGAMLLQAITLRDQLYVRALRSVDYIQRYIFPGSFIPSLTAILGSFARNTEMKAVHLEDIGPHYARTLQCWRERFHANLVRVRQLGYPESFVRMWDYYLCYCEGGFTERQLGDVQLLLTQPGSRLPDPTLGEWRA
jgi:cyclopropane-fatty-acyl-phospholipid synthase